MSSPMPIVAAVPPSVPRPTTPAAAAPSALPQGRRLARWTVEPTASGVPLVRASMRRALQGWGVEPERAGILLLAATELLSNAVRHTGGGGAQVCVTVALRRGRLYLDVADGDPFLPCVGPDAGGATAADVGMDAEGGRGLLIVNCLVGEADGRLTAFRVPSGKVVGVRIPAAPA
ncbi:ATP-binding protein [Streptomyces katrae]|uniref:ATP-binding protein n=1 Tax=Streptomyces katrae TaxID=68223 RepID=UPI0009A47772|nr:ATP-binding protein [Streptomyces katrae]